MDNIKGTVINEGGYFIVILGDGNLNFELYRPLSHLSFWSGKYDLQILREDDVELYVVKDGELK